LRRCLACLAAALGGTSARADGIAVSTDGLIWTKGAGAYGDAWEVASMGISVRAGGTLYIKYYSDVSDATLCYTEHGRKAGAWRTVGPVLANGVGALPSEPVILKISDVGTSKSTVAWINGRGKSGLWPGLRAPGPYDLALHDGAKWTAPPIVVVEAPKRPSFWTRLFSTPDEMPKRSSEAIFSVPDEGITAVLFAFALLILAMAQGSRTD
jgi:hypothetical protein